MWKSEKIYFSPPKTKEKKRADWDKKTNYIFLSYFSFGQFYLKIDKVKIWMEKKPENWLWLWWIVIDRFSLWLSLDDRMEKSKFVIQVYYKRKNEHSICANRKRKKQTKHLKKVGNNKKRSIFIVKMMMIMIEYLWMIFFCVRNVILFRLNSAIIKTKI